MVYLQNPCLSKAIYCLYVALCYLLLEQHRVQNFLVKSLITQNIQMLLHCFQINVPEKESQASLIPFPCVDGLTPFPGSLQEFFFIQSSFTSIFLGVIFCYFLINIFSIIFCLKFFDMQIEPVISETFLSVTEQVFDLVFYIFLPCLLILTQFFVLGLYCFLSVHICSSFQTLFCCFVISYSL